MVQWSRVGAALPENPSSVPRSQAAITTCNSSSVAFLVPAHTWHFYIQMQRYGSIAMLAFNPSTWKQRQVGFFESSLISVGCFRLDRAIW